MTKQISSKRSLARSFIKFILVLGLVSLGGSLFSGCKKDSAAANAFQSASPEKKALWDAASAAINSNDYLGAITNLDNLRAEPDLSADQKKAVDDADGAIRGRMFAAADKGDSNAQKAIDELRNATLHH